MKCSRCAQENSLQDKFCPECRTRLRGDPASNGGSDRQAQIQNDDLRRALADAAEQQAATAEILKVISASPNTACSVNGAFCGVHAP
jgi:predicted amidophosphoribosyltransferase